MTSMISWPNGSDIPCSFHWSMTNSIHRIEVEAKEIPKGSSSTWEDWEAAGAEAEWHCGHRLWWNRRNILIGLTIEVIWETSEIRRSKNHPNLKSKSARRKKSEKENFCINGVSLFVASEWHPKSGHPCVGTITLDHPRCIVVHIRGLLGPLLMSCRSTIFLMLYAGLLM